MSDENIGKPVRCKRWRLWDVTGFLWPLHLDPFQESPCLFHLWHANWISVGMQITRLTAPPDDPLCTPLPLPSPFPLWSLCFIFDSPPPSSVFHYIWIDRFKFLPPPATASISSPLLAPVTGPPLTVALQRKALLSPQSLSPASPRFCLK